MKTCGSCEHFRKLAGQCRKNPPKAVAIPVPAGPGHIQLHVQAVWPPVTEGEAGCGEYSPTILPE